MSLQLRTVQETPSLVSSYDPDEKRRITVSTADQDTTNRHMIITSVLRPDAWHTVLSNTRHVQVIRHNLVAPSLADPYCCCCCEVVYKLEAVGMHQHCNLFSLALVRTVCGRPVRTSSSKLSPPYEKRRYHLRTTLRLNASSHEQGQEQEWKT